jgi:23S rRNA pseudouridine2605 synthase
MRLNKFIAHSGICSRREADELITAGVITVNDEVITELGSRVKQGDLVKYNGERIRSEKKVYILLNKPKDYVTTNDDPEGRKTVLDLIRNAGDERVYPVGRLDRNTTGVLLLTNDGEIAAKLSHPKFNRKKIYHIFLDKPLTTEDFDKVIQGVQLEDGFVQPDSLSYVSPETKSEVGLEIHSGKNRIVRRIFESLGYDIDKLDRVSFAGLTKKNLPSGKLRFLSEKDVNMLKMKAFE